MKALYRRYRPTKLSEVVGQPQVTEPLENALTAGKVNHAYLFIGPRGCGKTTVARILAHEVNGFKYELEDDHVDIIEIDGASNRGIDDVRELREKAAIAPTTGKYKVYIIDEVHMLTTPAFNALLKTLEEPPAHVIFIMATTDAHKVPVTITSRSQTYTFKLSDAITMTGYLADIAKAEGINIDNDALKTIARRGGGSFRDSLSLLDQISTLSDQMITKEMVISAMGLPEEDKITELLNEYSNGNVVKITTVLKDLLASGIKPELLAGELIAGIINNPRPELLPLLTSLPDIKDPYAEARLLAVLCASGRAPTVTAPPVKQAEAPTRQAKGSVSGDFDWQRLLNSLQNTSDVIYKQLNKCGHEVRNGTLHLYPRTKIIKNIIDKPNNKKIITGLLGNYDLMIHDAGEHPESKTKDETLSKISDIMGGKVINDGGSNPF